jgi:hypothetical protein
VPDVVEMQLQREGAVEVAMGGQPSHVSMLSWARAASMLGRCRVVRDDTDVR